MRKLLVTLAALPLLSCSDATSPASTTADALAADARPDGADSDAVPPGLPPVALPPITAGLEVETAQGTLAGTAADGMRRFIGVPFAAPPVGALRFRPPQPHPGWSGVRAADGYGAACLQANILDGTFDPTSSEDCLYLNVYAPDPAPAAHLPVMVWIHGGAFVSGNGGGAFFAGDQLMATGDVVVVTLNYRLGAPGFVHLPDLAAEPGGATANLGLQDQVAALGWVRENIGRFGGDANDVTVFGQSAGGMSVCSLMALPMARGLFHAAISQSGICHLLIPEAADAEAMSVALADALGCADPATRAACLRGKAPEELVTGLPIAEALPGGAVWGTMSVPLWLPFVDGEVLPEHLSTAFDAGHVARVPLLLGTTSNEGELFHAGLLGDTAVLDEAAFLAALARRFGDRAGEVAALYPVSAYPDRNEAITEATTDAVFICPARRAARAMAAVGQPVWRYSFERDPTGVLLLEGAFHTAELPYVFGHDGNFTVGTLVGEGVTLSEAMRRYWTRFAHAKDPNGAGDAAWPAYETATDPYLRLDTPIAAAQGLRAARCDVYDTLTDRLRFRQLGL